MSHKSVPHSTNETNTVVSASHMHASRERNGSIIRPGQMTKLTQVATNSGTGVSFGMRNSNGMAHDQ